MYGHCPYCDSTDIEPWYFLWWCNNCDNPFFEPNALSAAELAAQQPTE